MKKLVLKVYIWACYIVVAPLLVLFTIGMIIWENVDWFCDFKEFMPVEYSAELAEAMIEGIKEGHKANMDRINALCEEG